MPPRPAKALHSSLERPLLALCGPYGLSLKAPTPRKSSKHPLSKRCRIGSMSAVKRGLKNAGSFGDLARPESAGERVERAGDCAVAIEPCAGESRWRSSSATRRLARVGID